MLIAPLRSFAETSNEAGYDFSSPAMSVELKIGSDATVGRYNQEASSIKIRPPTLAQTCLIVLAVDELYTICGQGVFMDESERHPIDKWQGCICNSTKHFDGWYIVVLIYRRANVLFKRR
jgi:hypothetical protein